LVIALSAFCGASTFAGDLAGYSADLRKKFPDVPVISTSELAGLAPASISILLDARGTNEFVVSHLPGAQFADPDVVAQLKRLGIGSQERIVVYCSVGYRSALMVRKLRKAGFTNVQNLEGSIFAWANEGRALENAAGATHGVHPFNVIWGRYLEKSRWQWRPVEPRK